MSDTLKPLGNPEGPNLPQTEFPVDEFPDPPQSTEDLGADGRVNGEVPA